jgi:hypothetical protein
VGLDDSSIDLVYDITPRGDGLKDVRGQTILSTTFRDFALHTDGYNADPPPRLMILQVAIAGIGGLTTLARVSDTVALLNANAIESLMEPVFPAAPGPTAILSSHGGEWRARYNGHEINRFLAAEGSSGVIKGRHLSALTELSDALGVLESRAEGRLHLQQGDVVVLDNQLILHGRLALAAEDRDRLLHRVWCA